MESTDIEAISGICGSISIACWVVVFSPQIVENFRRSSAEGLSIVFIIVWLAGDVFNILGAVLQGVLPTMTILAVYYTLADIVLLAQCFYYRGFTLSDSVPESSTGPAPSTATSTIPRPQPEPTERSALLTHNTDGTSTPPQHTLSTSSRRGSFRDHLETLTTNDATRLSPANPMHATNRDEAALKAQSPVQRNRPLIYSILFNLTSIILVCAAGVLGWYLSLRSAAPGSGRHHNDEKRQKPDDLHFNVLGQVFGYICAVLYLGSRLPQLLLNYRRKSTEGISMLFFLFACIGNLTYVLSILAYAPVCARHHYDRVSAEGPPYGAQFCSADEASYLYGRNFLVNFSWLLGSFGTLLLDAGVFVQYFVYRKGLGSGEVDESAVVDE